MKNFDYKKNEFMNGKMKQYLNWSQIKK